MDELDGDGIAPRVGDSTTDSQREAFSTSPVSGKGSYPPPDLDRLFKWISGNDSSSNQNQEDNFQKMVTDVYAERFGEIYHVLNDLSPEEQKAADAAMPIIYEVFSRPNGPQLAKMLFKIFEQDKAMSAEEKFSFIRGVAFYAVVPIARVKIGLQEYKEGENTLLDTYFKGRKYSRAFSNEVRNFSIGDFITHALTSEVSPQNIHELIMVLYEVPALHFAKYYQNVNDAIQLEQVFTGIREFVHRSFPGVHETISAMIHFYETADESLLQQKLESIKGDIGDGELYKYKYLLFNRDMYEKVTSSGDASETGGAEKVISILKRIAENTKPLSDPPPQTTDEGLNVLLSEVEKNKGVNGITQASTLGNALDHINKALEGFMAKKETGIDPNFIVSVAWLKKEAFHVLQNLSFEDQIHAFRQPWFLSIIKFQELTATAKDYNPDDFNTFTQMLINVKDSQTAYKLIAARLWEPAYQFTQKYKNCRPRWKDILLRGNVAEELIELTSWHKASSEQGRKMREELTTPEYLRITGD